MREITRHLCVYCKPLHAIPIVELDRRRIAILLESLARDSGPTAANRTRSSLSTFLGWCIGSGYIEHNPVSYTPQQAERPRQRVPNLEELRAIWSVLGDDTYSTIVRLLLLLGLRRAEVGNLAWSEVDFAASLIVLPKERVKAKRVHVVPLTDSARALLKAQPRRDQDSVFGQSARGYGFESWSGGKRELDAKLVRPAIVSSPGHCMIFEARSRP